MAGPPGFVKGWGLWILWLALEVLETATSERGLTGDTQAAVGDANYMVGRDKKEYNVGGRDRALLKGSTADHPVLHRAIHHYCAGTEGHDSYGACPCLV